MSDTQTQSKLVELWDYAKAQEHAHKQDRESYAKWLTDTRAAVDAYSAMYEALREIEAWFVYPDLPAEKEPLDVIRAALREAEGGAE